MAAIILLVLGGFCISCVILLVLLKYIGIITALAFMAIFYFISYTSALLAGVCWFAGVWFFGQDNILLVSAFVLLIFLFIFLTLSRYVWNRFKTVRFIKNY